MRHRFGFGVVAASIAAVLWLVAAPVQAQRTTSWFWVCHMNSHWIVVSQNALDAHLNHGDSPDVVLAEPGVPEPSEGCPLL